MCKKILVHLFFWLFLFSSSTSYAFFSQKKFGPLLVQFLDPVASPQKYHGYTVRHFRIKNEDSVAHRVTLSLEDRGRVGMNYLKKLSRSHLVAPHSSIELTLSTPAMRSFADAAKVFIDGEFQGKIKVVPLYENFTSSSSRIGVVLLSIGIKTDFAKKMKAGRRAGFYPNLLKKDLYFRNSKKSFYFQAYFLKFLRAQLAIEHWPVHWLDYSRFDGIVMTGAEWKRLTERARQAILDYVSAGGFLFIRGSADISHLGEPVQRRQLIEESPVSWPFSEYDRGFGRIMFYRGDDQNLFKKPIKNVFVLNVYDSSLPWDKNFNIADINRAFPIIKKNPLPINFFYTLLLIFSVLVGPLLMRWLHARQKKIWIFWLLPLSSFGWAFFIVLLSVGIEGCQGDFRTLQVSILDQRQQKAFSLGLNGYYFASVPSEFLSFSLETEISPQIRISWRQSGRPFSMKIADKQYLQEGWILSHTPLHLFLRRVTRTQRRLILSSSNSSPTLLNSLGRDIEWLYLRDFSGKILKFNRLKAGRKIPLSQGKLITLRSDKGKGYPRSLREIYASERRILALRRLGKFPLKYLRKGTYIAKLEEELFLKKGIEADPKAREVFLFGIMGREQR